ncbi:Uncharacterised protein [Mycobacteroides abscessus subsp. abscessus]|nr:Uncharacterised protein [Mycobacteroides abscessus subsp. abscessus]SKT90013.1 Uncharacterised protein [Mycobacteroides abscessus subsp. abscessus]
MNPVKALGRYGGQGCGRLGGGGFIEHAGGHRVLVQLPTNVVDDNRVSIAGEGDAVATGVEETGAFGRGEPRSVGRCFDVATEDVAQGGPATAEMRFVYPCNMRGTRRLRACCH